MSLDFLKQIKVDAPPDNLRASSGPRKQWNPTTANTIRVWKNGALYPSQDLVDRFGLEYGNKPTSKEEKVTGNAFDIFSSTDLSLFQSPQPVILLNPVAKSAGKADAFASVGYNEDGTPKASVMDQGSVTFGKDTLLPMLLKTYAVAPSEEKGYIDLVLLGQDGETAQSPYVLPNGKTVCPVPKEISRGDKAGEMTYVRRENVQLFILYPLAVLHPEETSEVLQAKEEEVAETV
jgi:hypothetical protein